MAASGAASAFVGALTLRLRADYLAITTFGVAVVVQLVALNAQKLTGGAFGVAFIPRPFDSLAATPALYDLANLALVAIVVGVVYVALERLARSPGAGCCGRSAKTNAPRWRLARIRRATACRPSRSAAR